MKTIQINLYALDELDEKAREVALQEYSYFNVEDDWWLDTYEDANLSGLKITGFDIDRGAYCKGEFTDNATTCAGLILNNHGDQTATYQTAQSFLNEIHGIVSNWPKNADGEFVNEDELDDKAEEAENEFLSSLLEDYRILLQHEYEYLISERAVIETIEANGYLFTADGKKAWKLEKLANPT